MFASNLLGRRGVITLSVFGLRLLIQDDLGSFRRCSVVVLFVLLLEVSTGRGRLGPERDAELLAVIKRHSVLGIALVQPEKVLVVQSALGCDR